MISLHIIIILSLILIGVIGGTILYVDWENIKVVMNYQKDVMNYTELVMECDEMSSTFTELNCVAIGWGYFLAKIVYWIYLYFKAALILVIYDVIFLIKIVLGLY